MAAAEGLVLVVVDLGHDLHQALGADRALGERVEARLDGHDARISIGSRSTRRRRPRFLDEPADRLGSDVIAPGQPLRDRGLGGSGPSDRTRWRAGSRRARPGPARRRLGGAHPRLVARLQPAQRLRLEAWRRSARLEANRARRPSAGRAARASCGRPRAALAGVAQKDAPSGRPRPPGAGQRPDLVSVRISLPDAPPRHDGGRSRSQAIIFAT
jgi:hypothetical protein